MIDWWKGCPSCREDVYANDDTYRKYYACLQFGPCPSDDEVNLLYSSGLNAFYADNHAVYD